MPFICTITSAEPRPRTYSSIRLLPSRRQYSPALVIPGPGTRPQGTVPTPQSSLKSFHLAHPEPAYPAQSIPSHRSHGGASSRHSSCSPASGTTLGLLQGPWVAS